MTGLYLDVEPLTKKGWLCVLQFLTLNEMRFWTDSPSGACSSIVLKIVYLSSVLSRMQLGLWKREDLSLVPGTICLFIGRTLRCLGEPLLYFPEVKILPKSLKSQEKNGFHSPFSFCKFHILKNQDENCFETVVDIELYSLPFTLKGAEQMYLADF